MSRQGLRFKVAARDKHGKGVEGVRVDFFETEYPYRSVKVLPLLLLLLLSLLNRYHLPNHKITGQMLLEEQLRHHGLRGGGGLRGDRQGADQDRRRGHRTLVQASTDYILKMPLLAALTRS